MLAKVGKSHTHMYKQVIKNMETNERQKWKLDSK